MKSVTRKALLAALLLATVAAVLLGRRALQLLLEGDSRRLRKPTAGAPARPRLLVIAIDGVERDLLYPMLRDGELSNLAALLGGRRGRDFPHAHFDESTLAVLPSNTLAAWASVFTGTPPGVHGIAGNEFFVREREELAPLAPVSLSDTEPLLAVYADSYADQLLEVPTVYERLRQREPEIRIWVSMSQFHRGANRFLLASRTALAEAAAAFLQGALGEEASRKLYGELDEEVVETVVDELEEHGLPDVLTVYFPGPDLYAHSAEPAPDEARRAYLREATDAHLGVLGRALEERGFLEDAYVVVVSDHGHTQVRDDAEHALSVEDEGDPPAVLRAAGYRLRPFRWKLAEDAEPYDAVLAYNGAMAFLSLADRSLCAGDRRCDWSRPPRFEEDVVPAAEAFLRANAGETVPELKDTLDLVFVRRRGSGGGSGGGAHEPFAVYLGGGRTLTVEEYLAQNPRPEYPALAERLAELATGPHGHRAGDVLLLAHNGNREDPQDRYYFSHEYRSWHGSPSRRDSEIVLLVAHRKRSAAELERTVAEAMGAATPREQWRVAELLLALRGR